MLTVLAVIFQLLAGLRECGVQSIMYWFVILCRAANWHCEQKDCDHTGEQKLETANLHDILPPMNIRCVYIWICDTVFQDVVMMCEI